MLKWINVEEWEMWEGESNVREEFQSQANKMKYKIKVIGPVMLAKLIILLVMCFSTHG